MKKVNVITLGWGTNQDESPGDRVPFRKRGYTSLDRCLRDQIRFFLKMNPKAKIAVISFACETEGDFQDTYTAIEQNGLSHMVRLFSDCSRKEERVALSPNRIPSKEYQRTKEKRFLLSGRMAEGFKGSVA